MTHPQSLSLTSWIHVFWHWILWLQLEYLWDTPVAALYCGAPRPHRCNLLPAFPTPPGRLCRFRRGIPSRGSRLRTWTTLYQRQGPGPTMDDPMLLQHLSWMEKNAGTTTKVGRKPLIDRRSTCLLYIKIYVSTSLRYFSMRPIYTYNILMWKYMQHLLQHKSCHTSPNSIKQSWIMAGQPTPAQNIPHQK